VQSYFAAISFHAVNLNNLKRRNAYKGINLAAHCRAFLQFCIYNY